MVCESFDVFISFKNSDENGNLTEDAKIAEQLYRELSNRSISTFFSNITLLQLGESVYKDSIDNALDTSQVLVSIGTNPEYVTSNWVKYEWEGFHHDILSGRKSDAQIITVTKNMNPAELPRTLRNCQNFSLEYESIPEVATFAQKMITSKVKEVPESPITEIVENAFPFKERSASIYSSTYGNEFQRLRIQAEKGLKTDQTVFETVISLSKKKSGLTVLDVGSAYGFVAYNLFGEDERVDKVICIDNNIGVIDKGRELHKDTKLCFYPIDVEGCAFEQCLSECLCTEGLEKVDIIFSALTLHHLRDPIKVLRTLRKFINRGGYIILRGSDDGSKLCYPHEELMELIIQKTLSIQGVSDRLNGRKIYSQLMDTGYDDVQIFTFMRDLSGVDYDQREDVFNASFSYRLDYFKKEMEKDPGSIIAKNEYEWMKKALEMFEDVFFEKSFWYAEYDYVGIARR